MAQIYTKNQILKLLYNELDICDRIETEWAIESDAKLSKLYKKLSSSKKKLDKLVASPSMQSLNGILSYASNPVLVNSL
jgi:hypothetical protein